jgi:hypothetical protein
LELRNGSEEGIGQYRKVEGQVKKQDFYKIIVVLSEDYQLIHHKQ